MKRDFSGKLTTITFVYLVSPTILQNLKQIVRADNLIYHCIILAQIRSSCLFTQKDIFWQSWLLLYLPTVFFHATIFQKNHQTANHETERGIILAQFRCELLLQKWLFWKSWLTLLWSNNCVHHATSFQKNPQKVDHESEVRNFCPYVH